MGTSFLSWDGVTAYFMFADSPTLLMLFAIVVGLICISLITSIKKHEDKAFKQHLKPLDHRKE